MDICRLSTHDALPDSPYILSIHLYNISICPYILSVHPSAMPVCPYIPSIAIYILSIHLYIIYKV